MKVLVHKYFNSTNLTQFKYTLSFTFPLTEVNNFRPL